MENKKLTVLIVEDERIISLSLEQLLEDSNVHVLDSVATATEAVDCYCDLSPDVVLMDIDLDGPSDGIEAAKAIRAINPQARILFVTGLSHLDLKKMEGLFAMDTVLAKPVTPEQVKAALQRL